jgi:RNA polymerase sigma-70 factor (ECF subfamily)
MTSTPLSLSSSMPDAVAGRFTVTIVTDAEAAFQLFDVDLRSKPVAVRAQSCGDSCACAPCNRTGTDEAALIRKIVAGQRHLFGDLIAPHLTALSRIVRASIGDHPEVEDIVQQTALKAFTHLAQFRFEAAFKTWLIQIGRNEARQWRRKYSSSRLLEFTPHAFSELPIADQRPSPLIEYQRSEITARLGAAVAHLPEKYRKVILLRDFEDLSISEVAVRLGLSIPAVKSRHRRARQKVVRFLEKSRTFCCGNAH